MLDREDLEDASVVEGNWRNGQPQGRFDMLRRVRQVTPATEASVNRDKYVEYSVGEERCHSKTEWWATEYYGKLTLVYFK